MTAYRNRKEQCKGFYGSLMHPVCNYMIKKLLTFEEVWYGEHYIQQSLEDKRKMDVTGS